MFEHHLQKPPVRLRPRSALSIGTTAFFRNRPLYSTLLSELRNSRKQSIRILFHACSVGAEVFSFVIHYLSDKFDDAFEISCEATDLNPTFLSVAKRARYPLQILDGMHAAERRYFRPLGQGVCLDEEVTRYVKFLSPSNFTAFPAAAEYDVVFLLNALIYVPEAEQARTIDSISSYNKEWLILSAFHQNTIKSDLRRNGYLPVLSNIEAIHNAWLDRRVAGPDQESRAGIYADWSLPEFSKIEDYEYKFGTLFRKSF